MLKSGGAKGLEKCGDSSAGRLDDDVEGHLHVSMAGWGVAKGVVSVSASFRRDTQR